MRERFQSAVVLTALPCEREAMVGAIEVEEEVEHPAGTVYVLGRLGCAPGFRVAVAEIGPGRDGSAVHVERAAGFLEPT